MNGFKYAFLKHSLTLLPNRKLFCPIPFKYMEICSGGKAILCCYLKKSPGVIKGNNLLELYNSRTARRIRESILDGTFRYCDLESCPHFSSGDLPLQKDCIGTPFEDIVKNKRTTLEQKSIWISFDRRCNLCCISCRGEHVKYSEKDHNEVERLLNIIKANLSYLNQIGLCGSGEPFASPSLRAFLKDFNASEYPNLKITILTNGMLFDEQAWSMMERGRSAIKSVQVSVDAATRESYEKIRIGGSFDKLMKNMGFISNLRKDGDISEFIISFVVNSINFSEMDAFVDLGRNLGCDQVYFTFMNKPEGISNQEYQQLAVHMPEHKKHKEFRKKLENPIFSHPIVLLGNIKRYRTPSLFRDSLFS